MVAGSSAAADGRVRAGDLLLAVNGWPVDSAAAAVARIDEAQRAPEAGGAPSDSIKAARGGHALELTFVAAEGTGPPPLPPWPVWLLADSLAMLTQHGGRVVRPARHRSPARVL